MNPGDLALRFDRVSLSFRYYASPMQRLRDVIWPVAAARHVPIPVLHDISFDLRRGETVALVGANGVGKSTVLNLAAQLLEPSDGSVTVNGRVATLDLGGAFLPHFTGRENARFYDRIVARHTGDWAPHERAIEEFAEIGEFYDRPTHAYSSGMSLRLAFACATCESPDILLIDEALAVGDARFQQKCYRRLREFRDAGAATLLVTHAVEGLPAFCDRVLVLEQGRLVFDGAAGPGIERYYQLFFAAPPLPARTGDGHERRFGTGDAMIGKVRASRGDAHETRAFQAGDVVRVAFEVEFNRAVAAPQWGFSVSTKEGTRIYATTTAMLGHSLPAALANERRTMAINLHLDVAVGDVFVDLAVFEVTGGTPTILDGCMGVLHLTVGIPRSYVGVANLTATLGP